MNRYLRYAEDRPKILRVENSAHLIVEHLLFKNSPYWTTDFDDVDGEGFIAYSAHWINAPRCCNWLQA